jgi:hypothetical protein
MEEERKEGENPDINNKIIAVMELIRGQEEGLVLDLKVFEKYVANRWSIEGIIDLLNQHSDYRVAAQTVFALIAYDLSASRRFLEKLESVLKLQYDDVLHKLDAEHWYLYKSQVEPALVPGIILGLFRGIVWAYKQNDPESALENDFVQDFFPTMTEMIICNYPKTLLAETYYFWMKTEKTTQNQFFEELSRTIKEYVRLENERSGGPYAVHRYNRIIGILRRVRDYDSSMSALGKEIAQQLCGKIIGSLHERGRIAMVCAAAEFFQKQKSE